MSYGDAVTCRAEISHFFFRTSLIDTKAVIGTCNYRYQCAFDDAPAGGSFLSGKKPKYFCSYLRSKTQKNPPPAEADSGALT